MRPEFSSSFPCPLSLAEYQSAVRYIPGTWWLFFAQFNHPALQRSITKFCGDRTITLAGTTLTTETNRDHRRRPSGYDLPHPCSALLTGTTQEERCPQTRISDMRMSSLSCLEETRAPMRLAHLRATQSAPQVTPCVVRTCNERLPLQTLANGHLQVYDEDCSSPRASNTSARAGAASESPFLLQTFHPLSSFYSPPPIKTVTRPTIATSTSPRPANSQMPCPALTWPRASAKHAVRA